MRIDIPEVIEPARALGVVHFVGIGGAGLSAIARLMAGIGVTVQGSDVKDSAVLRSLRSEGIRCFVGHDGLNLDSVDTVIASTAVPDTNPEIIEAQRRRLRLWPRSAGLKSLMVDVTTVAVAGTHGKTTTTAMLTCALEGAGVHPTFAIGAEVPTLGTNARVGSDPVFVVEADESDGAFLVYSPQGAVVTNVDADHLDTYGSVAAYDAAFDQFVDSVADFVVINLDDGGAAHLVARAQDRGLTVVTTGFDPNAHVRGSDVEVSLEGTSFTATIDDERFEVALAVPGQHYAQDALLALAAGRQLGHQVADLVKGLAEYRGAARRMESVGQVAGVRVFDSYAHHPTEIAADLTAARAMAGTDRLFVAFQPHLVSRTRQFAAQMGAALSKADVVVLADIYLAREEPDEQVTSQLILDALAGEQASLGGPVAQLHDVIVAQLRSGDFLLTLGAGDITEVGPRVIDALASRTAESHE